MKAQGNALGKAPQPAVSPERARYDSPGRSLGKRRPNMPGRIVVREGEELPEAPIRVFPSPLRGGARGGDLRGWNQTSTSDPTPPERSAVATRGANREGHFGIPAFHYRSTPLPPALSLSKGPSALPPARPRQPINSTARDPMGPSLRRSHPTNLGCSVVTDVVHDAFADSAAQ
jgi:hypothetical protein